MKVVGLVGGIASGKSVVADALTELGAARFDADQAGHQALQEPDVAEALVQRWGRQILDQQGRVSRPAVARIVFGSAQPLRQELEFLEGVTHPKIRELLSRQLRELAGRDVAERDLDGRGVSVLVVDAALLFEAGWDEFCDLVVYVDAPPALRQQRAGQRGWSAEQLAERESAQLSLAEKRRRADMVIDNSQSLEHTRRQVEQLWRQLQETG